MTKEWLRELQEMAAVIQKLEAIDRQLDKPEVDIIISTGCEDMQFSDMPVRMYPKFFDAFKQFIREQLKIVSDAFEQA